MTKARPGKESHSRESRRPPRRRARGSLTVEEIVDAAVGLAQEGGLEGVTMPKLARSLECGVMTLYGYVGDKDSLLALLCSRVYGDLDIDRATGLGWVEVLRRFSIGFYRTILEFPALGQLLLTRRMWSEEVAVNGEWLFGELVREGWTLQAAVRAFYAVQNYTLGSALFEAGRKMGDSTAAHERWWGHALADLPVEDYPITHAAAEFLRAAPREDQFLWGLERLLSGLQAAHSTDTTQQRGRR